MLDVRSVSQIAAELGWVSPSGGGSGASYARSSSGGSWQRAIA